MCMSLHGVLIPCGVKLFMAPVKKPIHARSAHFARHWRDYKGLSQERASEGLDIDRTTLSKIENGKVPYNQDLLEKMALIYGCDPSDLISVNPLTPRETEVIRLLRHAPEPDKSRLLTMLEGYLKTGTGG